MIAKRIEKSITRAIEISGILSDMGREAAHRDGRLSRRVPDQRTLAGRVQLLRESRGWSQGRLAKEAGLAQATVANIERGQTQGGRAVTLAKIAKSLNVDPEWLRTGKGEPMRIEGSSEGDILTIFRQLNTDNRTAWTATGRALLATQRSKK